QEWKQVDGQIVVIRAGLVQWTPEESPSNLLDVLEDKLSQLVDDGNRVEIGLALGSSPGEQAMPPEHDAVALRIGFDRAPQHHGQLESGPLPRNPNQTMAETPVKLLHPVPSIGRSGQGNAPIGVQMVDVREGKEAVQGGVNRASHRIGSEGAKRIEVRHFVFVL